MKYICQECLESTLNYGIFACSICEASYTNNMNYKSLLYYKIKISASDCYNSQSARSMLVFCLTFCIVSIIINFLYYAILLLYLVFFAIILKITLYVKDLLSKIYLLPWLIYKIHNKDYHAILKYLECDINNYNNNHELNVLLNDDDNGYICCYGIFMIYLFCHKDISGQELINGFIKIDFKT